MATNFELTTTTRNVRGRTVYQIKNLTSRTIGSTTIAVDALGGYAEKESNLEDSTTWWVGAGNNYIFDDALIKGNTYITGSQTEIHGSAIIDGATFHNNSLKIVGGNSRISLPIRIDGSVHIHGDVQMYFGNTTTTSLASGSEISGRARIYDNARIVYWGNGILKIHENCEIFGNSYVESGNNDLEIKGRAKIYGDSWIECGGVFDDDCHIRGDASLEDNTNNNPTDIEVRGNAIIEGDATLEGYIRISGNVYIGGSYPDGPLLSCNSRDTYPDIEAHRMYISGDTRIEGTAKLIGPHVIKGGFPITSGYHEIELK